MDARKPEARRIDGTADTLVESMDAFDPVLLKRVKEDSRARSVPVDVSSTLLVLGRECGDSGTRSVLMSRMVPSGFGGGGEDELDGFELTESSRRYEHLRLLGLGGMGQVDQVWDHDLMRKLAIKRLHPDRAENGIALRQFLWEARVTAHLDHPNIVPVHDLGLDDNGELYFTMKFVHGVSLDELIGALSRVEEAAAADKAPTAVDEVISAEHLTQLRRVRLFLDICQAIAYAHERGVLHRDLKPANVMIGQYGEVLIMDWGLALPLPGPAGENLRELQPDVLKGRSVGRPSGTPRYMSPEQVRGQPLDARSDIYSLGIILYELLTLRSPYSATEVADLLFQVTEARTEALTTTGPSVPDSLTRVVDRALARDPDDRYGSVRELVEDIEAILDGVSPVGKGAAQASPVASPAEEPAPEQPEGLSAPGGTRPVSAVTYGLAGALLGLALATSIGVWLHRFHWPVGLALCVAALGLVVGPGLWQRARSS